MTLTIKKPSVKVVPVEVIKIKWVGTVSPRLEKIRCSACHQSIGQGLVAIAWIKDSQGERSMRLCEDCGKKAEEPEKKEPDPTDIAREQAKEKVNVNG